MQGGPCEVDCSYLVGCDGAGSSIRCAAGIEMKGPAALQHLVNIHFFCPGLWQHILQRPAMLYFVFNSQVVSVLVGHDLPSGELVAQVAAFRFALPCCNGPLLLSQYLRACPATGLQLWLVPSLMGHGFPAS